jgi:hypothetical protein
MAEEVEMREWISRQWQENRVPFVVSTGAVALAIVVVVVATVVSASGTEKPTVSEVPEAASDGSIDQRDVPGGPAPNDTAKSCRILVGRYIEAWIAAANANDSTASSQAQRDAFYALRNTVEFRIYTNATLSRGLWKFGDETNPDDHMRAVANNGCDREYGGETG